jgi:hypothetical protein
MAERKGSFSREIRVFYQKKGEEKGKTNNVHSTLWLKMGCFFIPSIMSSPWSSWQASPFVCTIERVNHFSADSTLLELFFYMEIYQMPGLQDSLMTLRSDKPVC